MKKTLAFSFSILLCVSVVAQESPEQKLEALEISDSISFVNPDTLIKNDKDYKDFENENRTRTNDTTTIRFGNKMVIIIEKDGKTSIEIPEKESRSRKYSEHSELKRIKRFKGHWAGFEWGFNGFMDPSHSINMKDDLRYLELKQGRSWNLNLNIAQYSLGFGTDKIGLVTGLGFEFNNYHFRNKTTIKVMDGITQVDSSYILDVNKNVLKSKLSTTHLTAPLLLEFQIPTGNDRHRIFISAGVIGGVKLCSHTKIKFDGTNKGKDKIKDDFNLSAFRYGLTARIGYRGLKLFANYYPTPMFEEGKGPEIYPFSIGLILASF